MREKKILALADAAVSDDGSGSFSGYASLWDIKDSQGDIVVKGAYTETIPQFIERGFIGWSHDWAEPVATIREAREDDRGLFIVADFHSDPQSQIARTRTAERLARGKFMGLSIGYQTDDSEAAAGARLLKKLTLFETSLVTVPALAPAGVTSAKAGAPSEAKYAGLYGAEPPDGSFEALSEDIGEAFRETQIAAGIDAYVYVVATYPTSAVICVNTLDGEEPTFWDVTYVMSADGETITLGSPQQVEAETTFTPMKGTGLPYSLHAARVEQSVRELTARTQAGSALRAKEGRAISESRRTQLAAVHEGMQAHLGVIAKILDETAPKDPEKAADADQAFAALLAIEARLNGVAV